jgi:hypothetical protein
LWASLFVLRRRPEWRLLRGLAAWVFLLVLLTPLATLHEALLALGAVGLRPLSLRWALLTGRSPLAAAGSVLLWTLIVVAFARWRERAVRALRIGVICLAPLTALTLIQMAWLPWSTSRAVHREIERLTSRSPQPRQQVDASLPRVVWLIFDQLDFGQAFASRQPDVSLPAFDRLRASALHATQAFSPAPTTLSSLPSLLSGEIVVKATPIRTGTLAVQLKGALTSRDWQSLPSVFAEVRLLGGANGLYGTYHPYCLLFGPDLDDCLWVAWVNAPRVSLPAGMVQIARSLLDDGYGPLAAEPREADQRAKFLQMRERVLSRLRQPQRGLVFVHWPIPHQPFIYDRRSASYDIFGRAGYVDNLALADAGRGRRCADARGAVGQHESHRVLGPLAGGEARAAWAAQTRVTY